MALFTDGGMEVALGEFAAVQMTYRNSPLLLPRLGLMWPTVLEQGGDVNTLTVSCEQRFAARSQAEAAAFEMIFNLLLSGRGDLIAAAGTYGDCFFVSGSAEIRARRVVHAELEFLQGAPRRSDAVAPVDEFGEPSTTEGADYSRAIFGGVSLGDYSECVAIAGRRTPVVNAIPRCYGAWVEEIRRDAQLFFTIRAWKSAATRGELDAYMHNLTVGLGSAPAGLVLSSSLGACHLVEARLEPTADNAGWITMRFLKDMS